MTIRTCKKCGFILGTKPGLKEIDGVCLACINAENKKKINFEARQQWLTKLISENTNANSEYDCAVAVSGGKDSHMILERLVKNHGVKNPLLITLCDEFTATKAGLKNRDNICKHFNADHITVRLNPDAFLKNTLHDFEESLHPLKWLEDKLYRKPIEIAKSLGINIIFFGENSSYDYGSSEELEIFHSLTDESCKVIFMGAIYPYSIEDSLNIAKKVGFVDLDYFNEWQRSGNIENYTQIDSIGYIVHLWCKFVKFGFQRVSDIACRFVREGKYTKEQAELLIKLYDYQLDHAAKLDFCKTLNITEEYFDSIVDKHANLNLVKKDINGNYRRLDVY
ncbi:MAG: hypothetical protein RR998_04545 [Oscillospiraceae bacterium]